MIGNAQAPPGGWPSALEVQEAGLIFRIEMLVAARSAEGALGETPGLLTQAEADLRCLGQLRTAEVDRVCCERLDVVGRIVFFGCPHAVAEVAAQDPRCLRHMLQRWVGLNLVHHLLSTS